MAEGKTIENCSVELENRNVTPSKIKRVIKSIDNLICVIENNIGLIESNICDFFTCNQWHSDRVLKTAIREELENYSYQDLLGLPKQVTGHLKYNAGHNINLGTESESVDSPKTPVHKTEVDKLVRDIRSCCIKHMDVLSDLSELLIVKNDKPRDLMSQKKSHEISVMSDLCASLHETYHADTIIDVGSGKGYLGVDLALHHGLSVLSVDSSANNTHGASERYSKLSNTRLCSGSNLTVMRTCKNDINDITINRFKEKGGKFLPISEIIDATTDLLQLIETSFAMDKQAPSVLLTGLHCCGSLTSDALRLFVNSHSAVAVCVVGCCYHLLRSQDNAATTNIDTKDTAFPMSSYVRSKNFDLGHAALNLAGQGLGKISAEEKLQGDSFFNRALLQLILRDVAGIKHLPKDTKLRNLQKRSTSTYEYVHRAFVKLGIPTDTLSHELVERYSSEHLADRHRISAFCQLRYLFAPCVEAIILLDRVLWLLHQDVADQVHLVQLFDDAVSPRCYAIVAAKKPAPYVAPDKI